MAKRGNKCSNKPASDVQSGKGRPHNNNNNKGRRPKQKEEMPSNAKLDSTGRDNDPNWYFTDPKVAEQAAELSFQSFLGSGPVISNYEVPSILTFRMIPSPGVSYQVTQGATTNPTDSQVVAANTTNLNVADITDTKDGINLMSTKLYTLLSTYSGRTSSYGPQDIAIMHLAIGELVSTVEYIRRAFGVAMSYNPRNRMLPMGLLKAMNIDGQDLISNLANYRMRFNVNIARINQIPILDNVGYIRKCKELYQKIYVDDSSSMAQIYFYVPASTWILNETAVGSWTHGSWLKTTAFPTNGTMSQMLSLLETMINALLFSSTYNIVYADLINLANKINVPFQGFDYLDENYVVLAELNRNANLQMHNLTIWEEPTQPGRGSGVNLDVPWNYTAVTGANIYYTPYNNVYADGRNNGLLYNPVFPVLFNEMNNGTSLKAWAPKLEIVDMDTDVPTLEDRIEALRFKVMESGYFISQNETTPDRFFKIIPTLPDHYCIEGKIYQNPTSSAISIGRSVRDKYGNSGFPNESFLTQLKNAPILYSKNNATFTDTTVAGVYGDLSFFTTINFDYLYRLNRLISTGLFDFRTK